MTPWVQRLIIANVLIFCLQQMSPELTPMLEFVPRYILLRPWTIVTYMFLHAGYMHIGFNMLTLYFFGNRVEQRMGGQRFISLYFVSGIFGALLSFIFSPYAGVVGASGAIFGVMLAYARFWPRDEFLFWGVFPIQARWLVALSTGLALFGGIMPSAGIGGGVAHFAHLGGFLGGFLYLLFLDRNPAGKKFKSAVSAGPSPDALADKWQKVNRNSVHAVNKDEVNRILDKISANGIKSLTPQERQFLSNFVPADDRKPILPS